MIYKKINNKSQSEIVSSVLLILIVVIAVMIVSAFVIKLVRDSLNDDCRDIANNYELKQNPKYTCWKNAGNASYLLVQAALGDINESVKGFRVSVAMGGESKVYEIKKQAFDSNSSVQSYNQLNGTIELPLKNGERTYKLTGVLTKPEKIELYALSESGKSCSPPSQTTFIADCE